MDTQIFFQLSKINFLHRFEKKSLGFLPLFDFGKGFYSKILEGPAGTDRPKSVFMRLRVLV